jgi:exodeoxyribonuclease I
MNTFNMERTLASPQKTYLFYDVETTSLNPYFGQILQFAAIRTDLELNELERHEIRIKLNKDILPSPGAMLTHRMPISEMLLGESEYDAIRKIHALVNQPGTISGGYNTLEFDDKFLRFSFYRNLLDPYTHQYENDCGRFDIYPMVIYFYLSSKNNVLTWPFEDGAPSLKLENINALNQLATGSAHNAMVDVDVTLALARRLFSHRDQWDYVIKSFKKCTDPITKLRYDANQKSIYELNQTRVILLSKIGSKELFHAPVMCLGYHETNNNQIVWLRLDKVDFSTFDFTPTAVKELMLKGCILNKKIAERGLILPLMDRTPSNLSPNRKELFQFNQVWLSKNAQIIEAIKAYYTTTLYPVIENIDVDAALYTGGFINDRDKTTCHQFHHAEHSEKALIIEQFTDSRLKQIAIRIMGRHFEEHLSPPYGNQFNDYLNSIYTSKQESMPQGYKKDEYRPTRCQIQVQIDEERKRDNLTSEDLQLLSELENFIKSDPLVLPNIPVLETTY